MRLRPAEPADADGVAAILVALGWFTGLPDDPAAVADLVRAAVPAPDDDGRRMVVAEDAAGVAGYANWTVTRLAFLPGPSLYLTELFVRQDLRGAGVGARLLAEVHAHAEQVGAARVELLQHRDREAYRRGFYLGQGYREADVLAVMRRDGRGPTG